MPTLPAYTCPSCDYDVGQTLDDGFTVCPECGGEISKQSCKTTLKRLQHKLRQRSTGIALASPIVFPLVILFLGTVFLDLTKIHLPTSVLWWGVLAVFVLGLAVSYTTWLSACRRLGDPYPQRATIGRMAAMLLMWFGPLLLVAVIGLLVL